MSRLPGFVGPSNISRFIDIDREQTLNYYVSASGAGAPKADPTLNGRPGVTPFLVVGTGPHRASFQQDGLAWVISGSVFAEVFQGGTFTVRGSVAVDGNPAMICSNGGADGSGGHQLLIVSGGKRYIYDLVTHAFGEIVTPDIPGPWLMGIFINYAFLTLQSNGDKIYFSQFNDGSSSAWPGLNVLQIGQQPGNIAAIIASHNELWPFSATQVNPWVGTSESSTFTPMPGASIEYGIFAPWSLVNLGNTLFWISRTQQGGAIAVRNQGYGPVEVSTPAINVILQETANVDLTVGFTMQFDGHTFWLLYLPNGKTTLVYDLSTNQWTEWSEWDPNIAQDTPFIGRTHMFAFGKHLVGARDSGWLYDCSLDYWTDILKVGA